ncbi:MAG: DUF6923 family protein [Planctomycetota bacterium]
MAFVCGVTLLTAGVSVAEPVIYTHDSARHFGRLDLATGAFELIGRTSVVLSDVAFDPQENIYGCSLENFYSYSYLCRIDPATAATTIIGRINTGATDIYVNSLVFGRDGTLYAAGQSSLYSVNPATGLATVLGSFAPYVAAGDLAIDEAGTGYLSTTSNDLISLNLATGEPSYVGPLGFGEVYGMAFGPDKVLYGFSNSQRAVFSVDLATGAGTLVTTLPASSLTGAYGSGYSLEAVPEPTTLALVGVAACVVATLSWRKRPRCG